MLNCAIFGKLDLLFKPTEVQIMVKHLYARFFGSSLKDRAFSGAIITAGGFGLQKFVQLASNLILTRLLFPEAFGLMALVNVFIIGVQMLSDTGVRPALVRTKEIDDPQLVNTAWTIQFVRGFILWIAVAGLAYPASVIYGEPILFQLLLAAGSIAVFKGMHSIGATLAVRELKAWRTISVALCGQVVATISMIALALQFKSVWALCIGTIIGAAAEMALTYIVMPKHKHKFCFDKERAAELFHFGKWIFLATLLTYLGGQGIRAFEGAMVPTDTLGLIAIAATISWAAVEAINQVLGRIVFPALSEITRSQKSDFSSILAKLKLKILILTIPIFGLITIFSNFIIELLYDERYHFAGPMLAILALNGAISSIPTLYQTTVLSLGDTRMHLKLNIFATTLRLAGLTLGFQVGGVLGMLAGTGIGGILYYILAAFSLRKFKFIQYKADALSLLVLGALFALSFQLNIAEWIPQG